MAHVRGLEPVLGGMAVVERPERHAEDDDVLRGHHQAVSGIKLGDLRTLDVAPVGVRRRVVAVGGERQARRH